MSSILWILPLVSGATGASLFLFFLWAAFVSREEGEPQATVRLTLMAFLAPIPFYLPMLVGGPMGVGAAAFLLVIAAAAGGYLWLRFACRSPFKR